MPSFRLDTYPDSLSLGQQRNVYLIYKGRIIALNIHLSLIYVFS